MINILIFTLHLFDYECLSINIYLFMLSVVAADSYTVLLVCITTYFPLVDYQIR
jgi:hypothetical protein